ncbi:hypothetical protein [Anaerolinea sp.]|uniref:hypothetical protein n=1 Tax=Anaerolinea sp. TaxID=1872519 RepID=UPI002ACD83AF|nr:hypothetical protein [Anaerolinea sp.]
MSIFSIFSSQSERTLEEVLRDMDEAGLIQRAIDFSPAPEKRDVLSEKEISDRLERVLYEYGDNRS